MSISTTLRDLAPQRLVNEEEIEVQTPSTRTMEDRRRKTELVIAAVIAVSVVALVVAIVGIAENGHIEVEYEQEFAAPGSGSSEDKIWSIAMGHYDVNLEYLDEASGTIRGYNVDIVNAVCKIASKKCVIIEEDYERCFSSQENGNPRGGEGLLGGWYDACAGWGITQPRSRVFAFSKPYSKLPRVGLYVANTTNNFDWTDLRDVTVGFTSGFSSDDKCLSNYGDLIQVCVQ